MTAPNVRRILVGLGVLSTPWFSFGFLRSFGARLVERKTRHIIPSLQMQSSSSIGVKRNGGTSDEGKVAVLLCPAQFCVPVDYDVLCENLRKMETNNAPRISTFKVAPLPRSEWIKVAKSIPTKAYFDGELPVYTTLSWYFDAIEKGLSEIFQEHGPQTRICLMGHSIGGWVARAYLGGLSKSSSAVHRLAQERFSSFITLGTPHSSPESALVDQTRGLLKEVERTEACSAQALVDRGIDVTCVGSNCMEGKVSSNLEELVALSSYYPLLGRFGDVRGDGIVPTDLAFMDDPARRVEVSVCSASGEKVRHAHVVPTPWLFFDKTTPSISLPDNFAWYGSAGVLNQWAQHIR